jgi:hypothetical protein
LQSRGSLKLLERAAVEKLSSASRWHWQPNTLSYVVASVEVDINCYICCHIEEHLLFTFPYSNTVTRTESLQCNIHISKYIPCYFSYIIGHNINLL